jgi:hypothetical protein
MYGRKILIAVSAATVIGLAGLAPHAHADNVDQQERAAGKPDSGSALPWWAYQGGRGSYAYQPSGNIKRKKY